MEDFSHWGNLLYRNQGYLIIKSNKHLVEEVVRVANLLSKVVYFLIIFQIQLDQKMKIIKANQMKIIFKQI